MEDIYIRGFAGDYTDLQPWFSWSFSTHPVDRIRWFPYDYRTSRYLKAANAPIWERQLCIYWNRL